MNNKSQEQRFLEKLAVSEPGECWQWMGNKNDSGYGVMARKRGAGREQIRAHRFAWELWRGPIVGAETCVLHHCDNRLCCNPAHLFLGTRVDNIADMDAKGRDRRVGFPSGENHYMAKLTREMVDTIRSESAKVYSKADLAFLFNVSKKEILNIQHGRVWR